MIPSAEPWTFRPTQEPKFTMKTFDTTMIDGFGKKHDTTIKWEGYFYDNRWGIVTLEVKTKYDDYYFDEVVIECLELHLGKRVNLECKIQQI